MTGPVAARAMREALFVFLLVAGCVSPTVAPDPSGIAPAALALSEPVVHLDSRAREPDIVQTATGALFVTGYSGRQATAGASPVLLPFEQAPPLWRSDDGGRSWARVDVGAPADGALGNSDLDLAYRDGVLYLATMCWLGAGQTIQVGVSEDDGRTWRWRLIAGQGPVDRPWVAVAPDGTAHVVWNDGVGVHHALSRDRGATWEETAQPSARGGTGQLAIAPTGEVAVRIIPASGSGYTTWEGADGVAVSADAGGTWTFRPVPGEREYGTIVDWEAGETPRWADPLAFDAAGTLYTAWPEGSELVLAWSRDQGASWETALLHTAPDDAMAAFPTIVAHGPGELGITWMEFGESILAGVALVTQADSGTPVVRAGSYAPQLEEDLGGEAFGVVFLQEGGLGVVMTHDASADLAQRGFAFRVAR